MPGRAIQRRCPRATWMTPRTVPSNCEPKAEKSAEDRALSQEIACQCHADNNGGHAIRSHDCGEGQRRDSEGQGRFEVLLREGTEEPNCSMIVFRATRNKMIPAAIARTGTETWYWRMDLSPITAAKRRVRQE